MSADPSDIQQHYKNVFGTPQGRIVLGDILTMCHFGETLAPGDSVSVAEYNVGLTIARMAGAMNLIYPQLGMPIQKGDSDVPVSI